MDHKKEFLDAVKGIPTRHVTTALNAFIRGTNWHGCPKSHLAECYANSKNTKSGMHVSERDRWSSIKSLDQLRQSALQYQNIASERRERQLRAEVEAQARAKLHQEQERRRAACDKACEGISTEKLEALPAPFAQLLTESALDQWAAYASKKADAEGLLDAIKECKKHAGNPEMIYQVTKVAIERFDG